MFAKWKLEGSDILVKNFITWDMQLCRFILHNLGKRGTPRHQITQHQLILKKKHSGNRDIKKERKKKKMIARYLCNTDAYLPSQMTPLPVKPERQEHENWSLTTLHVACSLQLCKLAEWHRPGRKMKERPLTEPHLISSWSAPLEVFRCSSDWVLDTQWHWTSTCKCLSSMNELSSFSWHFPFNLFVLILITKASSGWNHCEKFLANLLQRGWQFYDNYTGSHSWPLVPKPLHKPRRN